MTAGQSAMIDSNRRRRFLAAKHLVSVNDVSSCYSSRPAASASSTVVIFVVVSICHHQQHQQLQHNTSVSAHEKSRLYVHLFCRSDVRLKSADDDTCRRD